MPRKVSAKQQSQSNLLPESGTLLHDYDGTRKEYSTWLIFPKCRHGTSTRMEYPVMTALFFERFGYNPDEIRYTHGSTYIVGPVKETDESRVA